MKIKKITFITAHNWLTKRLGGFHKFAEAACEAGMETIFFSFPRPYYALFMKDELYNRDSICMLKKGIAYNIAGSPLKNITLQTMRLPDKFGKFIPDALLNKLLTTSLVPFKTFAKKWLAGTDVFVFESNDGIALLDKIKKNFPSAKIVYRPSDPLMCDGAKSRYIKNEERILRRSDLSLLVNDGSINIYKKHIPDFETSINYKVLTNGVDIEPFEQKYPCPNELNKKNNILYIGAWKPDWDLVFESAIKNQDLNFTIICPNQPSSFIKEKIKEIDNLTYIPGIMPAEIPQWMTNCDVFMVPYNKEDGSRISGITAKYFQAMAAKKPIVAYYDTPLLNGLGIPVTHSYEEFIKEIRNSLTMKKRIYNYNLQNKRWSLLKKQFIDYLKEL